MWTSKGNVRENGLDGVLVFVDNRRQFKGASDMYVSGIQVHFVYQEHLVGNHWETNRVVRLVFSEMRFPMFHNIEDKANRVFKILWRMIGNRGEIVFSPKAGRVVKFK